MKQFDSNKRISHTNVVSEFGFGFEIGNGGFEDSSVVLEVDALDPLHVDAAKLRRRPLFGVLLQIFLWMKIRSVLFLSNILRCLEWNKHHDNIEMEHCLTQSPGQSESPPAFT